MLHGVRIGDAGCPPAAAVKALMVVVLIVAAAAAAATTFAGLVEKLAVLLLRMILASLVL